MFRIAAGLCAMMFLLSACGSSTDAEITTERDDDDDELPYPSRILVYDFATSPSEVSPDSVASGRLSSAGDDPQSNAQRQQLEHQIAEVVANRVVAELQELDLPAMRWRGPAPAGNSSRPGLAATLPVGSAISGIATASAVQTGVGLVTEMNTDVR